MRRTPLAWNNLIHDKRRLLIAIVGIAFAVMLMFQQRGFRLALFDSTVEIVQLMDCDVIVFNSNRFTISNELRFRRSLLDVAASHPQVAEVVPVYLENLAARLRSPGGRARPIRVILWDLNQRLFYDDAGEIERYRAGLSKPGTAIMDQLSREAYGFDLRGGAKFPQNGELSRKQLEVIGRFWLGRDFAHDGSLLMSVDNLERYFSYRAADPRTVVDYGVLRLAAGADHRQVAGELRDLLGSQVLVMTKQDFIDREINFWSRSTPIGIIFNIGMALGFVVGVIICYQILANDIAEHLKEFATLKAMGYPNRYFVGVVIRQAIYLSLLGFIPGLLLSWGLFWFNSSVTGLLMRLSGERILVILGLTLAMCIVSGLLALRKLIQADPAALF